ncbi:hypothetical protein WUBG_11645 [Wuchereria bancrofti]|uniref:Uncharacterized protein n=1 Tax=Wuchereria bancrofti TaxID=6293 RepID=J9EK85_WUCBA|nr:hypothetical protein WUBG_11645 [Wuchereria bancrofti]VDM14375.1 unnamed protein product [Wuchereria bancrofti]
MPQTINTIRLRRYLDNRHTTSLPVNPGTTITQHQQTPRGYPPNHPSTYRAPKIPKLSKETVGRLAWRESVQIIQRYSARVNLLESLK